MNKIVWFRYDLRLIDNEAFLNATKNGNILPIFIFDKGYFKLEVSSLSLIHISEPTRPY